LNVSVLCTAAFLTALFASFGVETPNSAPTSKEYQLLVEAGFGSDKQTAAAVSPGAAFPDDDGRLFGNPYLLRARDNDVVMCSFVGKVVICRRVGRSCPPQLLLPSRPAREQRRKILPPDPDRC
jgi:hypothetical protein